MCSAPDNALTCRATTPTAVKLAPTTRATPPPRLPRVQGQAQSPPMTGTVVDVGEGATHVVPVVDGYVLHGAVKSLPLSGRDVTAAVQQSLRCAYLGAPGVRVGNLGISSGTSVHGRV